MVPDDPFDRLVGTVVLEDPTEDIGVETFDGDPPLAYCPLLHEDGAGDEWQIGCCSLPECPRCPHLALRITQPSTWPNTGSLSKLQGLDVDDYHVSWVCSDCTHELKSVLYPGFYGAGECWHCGKESIVLQVVLLLWIAPPLDR